MDYLDLFLGLGEAVIGFALILLTIKIVGSIINKDK